jgi:hypothetical protein
MTNDANIVNTFAIGYADFIANKEPILHFMPFEHGCFTDKLL